MNKQAIIIGTSDGREKWVEKAVKSCVNPKYQVISIKDNGFELAHIKTAYEAGFDEFLYLHDSCEVKDHKLFDILFEQSKGKSVALSDWPCLFGMYLGKYTHSALSRVEIPVITTKLEAIDNEEIWTAKYLEKEIDNTLLLTPCLHDGHNFVTINDRLYMKLENDYIIKFKGTWHRSMI